MNYQYKHGGSFYSTLRALLREGGISRLYQGLQWAIIQNPMSRFGDTAANALSKAVLGSAGVNLAFVTLAGSMGGSAWRAIITPIDTCKTVLQTDGSKGMRILKDKVREGGLGVLWYGWEGNIVANVVGSYPWFITFNLLQSIVPPAVGVWPNLIRTAFIGACCSGVSDLISNSIRVIKTKKQTSDDPNVGYLEAARIAIREGGFWRGLVLRGLETRLLTNVLQGIFFTVLWRGLAPILAGKGVAK